MNVAIQNLVPIPDMAGCAEVIPAADGSTAAPGEFLTFMLNDAPECDAGISTPAGPVQICAAEFLPAEASQADDVPTDVPSDLLRQLAVLLKTVLGTTAFGNTGEVAVRTETPDAQSNRTADDDDSSSGDSTPLSEEQSLIQRLAAAVLAMLPPEQPAILGALVETVTHEDNVPQRSTEQLVTLLRVITRESTAPHGQTTDDAKAIPTQDTDPVQQLAAKLLDHLTSDQQDTKDQELPRSDELAKAGTQQQKTITSSEAQGNVRVGNLDALSPDGQAQETKDAVAIVGVHGTGEESTSDSSARSETTEHRREKEEAFQAEHPMPNQRVAETTSRFDVKTADAPSAATDRSRGEAIKPLPPQQAWTEVEAPSSRSSVHLEVTPLEVGRVRLHVSLAGDRVYANVTTEHPGVRDFLLGERPRLEGDLSAQGLEVGSFQVAVEHNGHRGTDQKGQTPWIENANRVDKPPRGEAEVETEEVGFPIHHEAGQTPHELSLFA